MLANLWLGIDSLSIKKNRLSLKRTARGGQGIQPWRAFRSRVQLIGLRMTMVIVTISRKGLYFMPKVYYVPPRVASWI